MPEGELMKPPPTPEMKLEVVPIPVSDIDRALDFYVNKLGFNLDFDTQASDSMRFAQLTPPGSGCSIVIGMGMGEISEMKPGSVKGVQLVIKDIVVTRDLFISRGITMGEIIEYPRAIKFSSFYDPDGNLWTLQEIPPGL